MEMFSCAEEWKGFDVMEFQKIEDVVVTIMERKPQEVTRYLKERKKPEKKQVIEESSSSSDKGKSSMEVDELESRLPTVGEDESELEAVDRQSRRESRRTELERLMDMKVLQPISQQQATQGSYKHLSTKIVYDWRHRDGQWKQR